MKKYIILLLSIFLILTCDDNTQTNDDIDDMMSLDWILLKKGINTDFYVESCDEYDDEVVYCICCDEFEEGVWDDCIGGLDECGDCRLYDANELFYKYELYWNSDIDVCHYGSACLEYPENYDITIPSYFPDYYTNDCDGPGNNNFCEREEYFHPNCDTPIDTTMMFGNKSVSIEKLAYFEIDSDYSQRYIHYYPLDNYLIMIEHNKDYEELYDIQYWEVVNYQRRQ